MHFDFRQRPGRTIATVRWLIVYMQEARLLMFEMDQRLKLSQNDVSREPRFQRSVVHRIISFFEYIEG